MTLQESNNNGTKTTRVCIKNVPPSFNEAKLTNHLISNSSSTLLQVTDCKILKTKNGKKSRKLAFVGFKTPEMARHVVSRFHQTYALTSKLAVELAFSKREASTVDYRPWSKHSVGSSRYEKLHPKNKDDKASNKIEKVDERKQEFLAAMIGDASSSSSKRKFWSNDDDGMVVVEGNDDDDVKEDKATKEDSDSDSSSDDSDSNNSNDNDGDSNDNDSIDSGGKGADVMDAFITKQAQGTVISDIDFMKSKVTGADNLDTDDESQEEKNHQLADKGDGMADDGSTSSSSSSAVSTSSSEDDEDSDDEQEQDDKVEKTIAATVEKTSHEREGTSPNEEQEEENDEKDDNNDDKAISSNRLFCRNLPFTTTEEELKDVFAEFGTVTECHIALDDLKRNKGYGFVSFEKASEAQSAMSQLDGTDFQGRLLHILPAKQRPGAVHKDNSGGGGTLTYKQQQLQQRQQNASQNMVGANASFVRGDAVVDNLSQRLGLNKGDILSVKDGLGAGDAAVRLALGETHIIEENRQYFQQHGIDMDALVVSDGGNHDKKKKNKSTKRSSTSILVKNLPYDTTLEDMTKLFHGVGGDAPRRILLPPSRTIALVEYGHAVDARRAFRKLAYKRFKHVPLYLEWAPLSSVVNKDEGSSAQTTTAVEDQSTLVKKTVKEPPFKEEEEVAEASAEPGVSHTIYVKNLNFATTEEQLRQVFEKHVKSIRAVKIPTKAAPIKRVVSTESSNVKSLSMGYGFVECDSDESVRKAIKALQGTLIDGHALELKRSSKQVAIKRIAPANEKNPTKLMVRNVPFQATRKELLQLFGSFGQLKKVRLPKKFDGSHRGFAFVEFLTSQEAQTAMNTLSRTHLYGRHLVLEWASDKEDISELRDKAKRDVLGTETAQRKNKKIRFE